MSEVSDREDQQKLAQKRMWDALQKYVGMVTGGTMEAADAYMEPSPNSAAGMYGVPPQALPSIGEGVEPRSESSGSEQAARSQQQKRVAWG